MRDDQATVECPGERADDGRTRLTGPMVCLALFALVLIGVQLLGVSGRRYAEERTRIEVGSAREAYAQIRDLGVRGRVLVVFDDKAHIETSISREMTFLDALEDGGEVELVTTAGIVGDLVRAGIAREVYVIALDSEWADVQERIYARGDVMDSEHGIFTRMSGARVHYVAESNIPVLDEEVVVYLPPEASRYPGELLDRFDADGVCDVYVVQAE
ncbi:MAG: hypothetical protein JXA36_04815 [Coriobacteriia bacterium]|nr:hypothetical protein [Coriobacteriia bacterium]